MPLRVRVYLPNVEEGLTGMYVILHEQPQFWPYTFDVLNYDTEAQSHSFVMEDMPASAVDIQNEIAAGIGPVAFPVALRYSGDQGPTRYVPRTWAHGNGNLQGNNRTAKDDE